MNKTKSVITLILSTLFSWFGILAIPIFLLVGCNIIDYATGILAAKYRDQTVNSYKGIRGIIKKICMWLLIVIGAFIDILINYAASYTPIGITIPFIVATIVAIWLVCNEIISILENIVDIGVKVPPFLLPIVKNIKRQTENKAKIEEESDNE